MLEEAAHPPARHRRSHRLITKLKIAGLLALIASVIVAGTAYYQSAKELNRLKNTPAVSADQQARELVMQVGRHMALPVEKPTIATVEDTKKLADQAFFKHAKNGDKVLMYTESKKAILYRPSIDKIMEVAYLNIQQAASDLKPNGAVID